MKKKPSLKAEKYMIGAAVGLIVISIVCALVLILISIGFFDGNGGAKRDDETTAAEVTTATDTAIHADVESETNEDGTPHRVVYYKDNKYDGSIEYVYDRNRVFEIYFDADDNLLGSIQKRVNEVGNLVFESHYEGDKKQKEIEYTYYDDGLTVWKKTTTEFGEDEKEIRTVKELYSENGLLTDKYVYEDSVEMSHTVYTYDENGEIASEEEVAK